MLMPLYATEVKKDPIDPVLTQCKATLVNNILTLENESISRVYDWNGGDLKSRSITDKKTNYTWTLNSRLPDAIFPGAGKPENGEIAVREVPASNILTAYLEAEVRVTLGSIEVKRIFRIFPDCPAISCTFYLRGSVSGRWLENTPAADGKPVTTAMEQLTVPGKHWNLRSVQFYDVTDRNNNLVQNYDQFLYRNDSRLVGNLLFANEVFSDHGLFILKEAPTSTVQLSYPGLDFLARFGSIQALGMGVTPEDLDPKEWTRCYGFVTGVTNGGEIGRLSALRTYQQKVRKHEIGRDDMILMNTWGDRNQDKRIGEEFTLRELHVPGDPLILFNIWDAGSAKIAASAGAKAIATGSASVAVANGFSDAEELPIDLALANAERIVRAVDLPVTIDFEGGYAVDPAEVGRNVARLAATGAIGCNFEDQVIGGSGMHDVAVQAARIGAIRAAIGPAFFINARTDIFLQAAAEKTHDEAKVDAAIERAHAYAAAGANSFFVPGLADLDLLKRVCWESPLPVNFMAFPGAPDAASVAKAGVARISHGPFPHRIALKAFEDAARAALAI